MSAIKWAVRVVDHQCHAIDVDATHPTDMYVALCRHTLLAALTSLTDGCRAPCLSCVAHIARAATLRQ